MTYKLRDNVMNIEIRSKEIQSSQNNNNKHTLKVYTNNHIRYQIC